MKQCNKCKEMKPEEAFSKKSSNKDGLQRGCKACTSAYHAKYRADRPGEGTKTMRAWREANPEKAKTLNAKHYVENKHKCDSQNKAWAKANPDKVRASQKKFKDANREQIRAEGRAYAKANPEKKREHCRTRRGKLMAAQQDGIAVDYIGKSCVYCGSPAECIDHFQPISRSFNDLSTNKVPACNACNFSKSDKDPCLWMQSREGFISIFSLFSR